MKKIVLLITAILFAASGINGQNTNTPQINKKQNVQLQKIKKGVKSGELTRVEAKVLLKKEAELQKKKKIAKADGEVTRAERKLLRKEAKKLDSKIYKQKHDKQKRK
jgi:hypothetical protein